MKHLFFTCPFTKAIFLRRIHPRRRKAGTCFQEYKWIIQIFKCWRVNSCKAFLLLLSLPYWMERNHRRFSNSNWPIQLITQNIISDVEAKLHEPLCLDDAMLNKHVAETWNIEALTTQNLINLYMD